MDLNLPKIKEAVEKYVKLFLKNKGPPKDLKIKFDKSKPSVELLKNVLRETILNAYSQAVLAELIKYRPKAPKPTENTDKTEKTDKTDKTDKTAKPTEQMDEHTYKSLLCLKQPVDMTKVKSLDHSTFMIGKDVMVTLEPIYVDTDNVNDMKDKLRQEYALLKRASALGASLKCTDAYICSNSYNQIFKVIYFKVPPNLVKLRKWLYDGFPKSNFDKMTAAARDNGLKKYRAVLKALHDAGIIYGASRFNTLEGVFVTFQQPITEPKGNKYIIDKIFLTDFSRSLDVKRSNEQLMKTESDVNPFTRFYERNDIMIDYVVQMLFNDKAIVVSD